MISKAKEYAKEKHEGQMYGDKSYHYHLDQVAFEVFSSGGDEYQEAIAWLHDTFEDTNATYEELKGLFGERIALGAISMTRLKSDNYNEYLDKLKDNEDALFVKKADAKCNLNQCIEDSDFKRAKKYLDALIYLTENKND